MGVIKRDRVHLQAVDVDRPRAATPRGGCRTQKAARLVHLEGKVIAVEFTCSCGETSLLELEYEGAPSAESKEDPK